MHELTPRVLG